MDDLPAIKRQGGVINDANDFNEKVDQFFATSSSFYDPPQHQETRDDDILYYGEPEGFQNVQSSTQEATNSQQDTPDIFVFNANDPENITIAENIEVSSGGETRSRNTPRRTFEGQEYIQDLFDNAVDDIERLDPVIMCDEPSDAEDTDDDESLHFNRALKKLATNVARSSKQLWKEDECDQFLGALGLSTVVREYINEVALPKKTLPWIPPPMEEHSKKIFSGLLKRLNDQDKREENITRFQGKYPLAAKLVLCAEGLNPSITKHILYEHTNWLIRKSVFDFFHSSSTPSNFQSLSDASNSVLYPCIWEFKEKYKEDYTLLKNSGMQCIAIKHALNALAILQNMVLRYQEAAKDCHAALMNMREVALKAIERKKYLRKLCNEQYDKLEKMSPIYDETSIWGIKPVRLALEPPYFKSESGLVCAPMPVMNDHVKLPKDSFFPRERQKWTTKDFEALKICLKEAILSFLDSNSKYAVGSFMLELQDSKVGETNNVENAKKKRGRTGRGAQSSMPNEIFSHPIADLCGIRFSTTVASKSINKWNTGLDEKVKGKSLDSLLKDYSDCIDFQIVSNYLMALTRKHRSAEDCRLIFNHELRPGINIKRWTRVETQKLMDVVRSPDTTDWKQIPSKLPQHSTRAGVVVRTPFQCFFRYVNKIAPPPVLEWDYEKDEKVRELICKHGNKWRRIAYELNDPEATKRLLIERYKKSVNPILRQGPFTRTEDCLLILTIELLKPLLDYEGHFGLLYSYLPWRFETTWRDRANNLFSDWIIPWTLEEDRRLIELADKMDRNWQKISEQFDSYKNRKGCLTRYKILQRRLEDSKYGCLEDYHDAYKMTRYNVFQYKHLKEIITLLRKINKVKKPDYSFPGIPNDRPPSEDYLHWMLVDFDRMVVEKTIVSLCNYVESRDLAWKEMIFQSGKRRRTFDRRTFHSDKPKSIASAIHIRRLKLVPKNSLLNMSAFEEQIYNHFAQFNRTKTVKHTTDRPYIPNARALAEWDPISRIIDPRSLERLGEEADCPISCELKRPFKTRNRAPATATKTTRKREPRKKVSPKKSPVVKVPRRYTKRVKKSASPVISSSAPADIQKDREMIINLEGSDQYAIVEMKDMVSNEETLVSNDHLGTECEVPLTEAPKAKRGRAVKPKTKAVTKTIKRAPSTKKANNVSEGGVEPMEDKIHGGVVTSHQAKVEFIALEQPMKRAKIVQDDVPTQLITLADTDLPVTQPKNVEESVPILSEVDVPFVEESSEILHEKLEKEQTTPLIVEFNTSTKAQPKAQDLDASRTPRTPVKTKRQASAKAPTRKVQTRSQSGARKSAVAKDTNQTRSNAANETNQTRVNAANETNQTRSNAANDTNQTRVNAAKEANQTRSKSANRVSSKAPTRAQNSASTKASTTKTQSKCKGKKSEPSVLRTRSKAPKQTQAPNLEKKQLRKRPSSRATKVDPIFVEPPKKQAKLSKTDKKEVYETSEVVTRIRRSLRNKTRY